MVAINVPAGIDLATASTDDLIAYAGELEQVWSDWVNGSRSIGELDASIASERLEDVARELVMRGRKGDLTAFEATNGQDECYRYDR